jgi:hypothetical protein
MDAIMESGSSASAPDNKIGWGIPDFIMANNILTIIDNDEASLLSEMKLYPNPFTSNFELSFVSEENGNAQLAIVDMTGRIISENSHTIDQGSNTIMINGIKNIPAGIYFLRLESGNAVITSKLIKR